MIEFLHVNDFGDFLRFVIWGRFGCVKIVHFKEMCYVLRDSALLWHLLYIFVSNCVLLFKY